MTAAPTTHPRWRALRDGLLLYLAVALGTAIGGVARALVSLAAIELAGPGFPGEHWPQTSWARSSSASMRLCRRRMDDSLSARGSAIS